MSSCRTVNPTYFERTNSSRPYHLKMSIEEGRFTVETFQPLINLLVLLTALSVAAERISNLVKLQNSQLRTTKKSEAAEKRRELAIAGRTLWVGIVLAILVKANFFEILTHLDNPWGTLGWVQIQGYQWLRTPATKSLGTFLFALAGSAITGIALGFGSKFWHDILSVIYEVRRMAKRRVEEPASAQDK